MDASKKKGLTSEEDDSLRRLAWFAETVGVSPWAKARIEDLRTRDRRSEIRSPREETISACAADILNRSDLVQVASEAEVLPIAGTVADSYGRPTETVSLTIVRQKKRRNPWSLRRNAKGS